jgi:hypothetical protein
VLLLAMLLLCLFSTNGRKPLEVKIAPPTELSVDGFQDSLCRTPCNAKQNGQTNIPVRDDDRFL